MAQVETACQSKHDTIPIEAAKSYLERDVISAFEALQGVERGNPLRPAALNGLALSLYARLKGFGVQHDLDRTIHLQREAIELTESGDSAQVLWRDDLGLWLLARFSLHDQRPDLDEAIKSTTEAVANENANY